jgi:ribonuclease HI
MTKFYAVKSGRKPGIYRDWIECEKQVKGFRGAIYKSFKTLKDAHIFIGTSLEQKKSKQSNPISQRSVLPKGTTSSKYYAVAVGKTPGVYRSWVECQEQIKGVSKAVYKSFSTESEALAFVQTNDSRKRKADDANLSHKADVNDSSHHADLQIYLLFDGGSRGNPGISGSGSYLKIIRTNNRDVHDASTKELKVCHYCGSNCTNNVAEYTGLLEGLKQAAIEVESYCKSKVSNAQISLNVKGDSNLIINQMNGVWQIKDLQLKKLHTECMKLVQKMKDLVQSLDETSTISISYTHVYRKENTVADGLANEAMDTKLSWVR